jgi:D-alanine-D-alanine ligase
MHTRVAIVFNEPIPSRYDSVGEEKAALGVLEAVEAVRQALYELDCDIVRIPLVPPIEQAKKELKALNVDLVFNLFEGFAGYADTEAEVAEILSKIDIPFTGCPAPALRLALDKAKTKAVLKSTGIRTPDFQVLSPEIIHLFNLPFPCIVKPCSEDASHGLSPESLVRDQQALEKQVYLVSKNYSGNALVERFIDGREFNATILGNKEPAVLPVSEIVYVLPSEMPRIVTFAAKWEPDSLYYQGTKVVCPADISTEEWLFIAEAIKKVFQLVGCRGYARVDMRLDQEGQLNIIEVNPNPDISPGAGTVRQAQAAGMNYTQFIKKIIELALEKEQ